MEFRRLINYAKVPTRASDGSAGYDIYGANTYRIEIAPHQTVSIDSGISIAVPVGLFAAIFARSGMATNRGLRPATAVSVIDEDYRGPLIIPIHNDSDQVQYIDAHERIAQLVFLPYYLVDWEEVDKLPETDRGDGGFGSTGTV